MSVTCSIEWNGIALVLFADRAAFRPETRTLYVADLHLGKPEHFRSGGAPVPERVTGHDLSRLATLLETTGAERLLVLGDLFHARISPEGETAEQLRCWRQARPRLRFGLVRGNHDRWTRRLERDFGIDDLGPTAEDSGLALVHDPADAEADAPTLAGHLHPALRLGGAFGSGATALRAPCFWLAERLGVLPAFGRFTGAKLVRPEPHHRAFITNGEAVIEVSGALRGRRPAV